MPTRFHHTLTLLVSAVLLMSACTGSNREAQVLEEFGTVLNVHIDEMSQITFGVPDEFSEPVLLGDADTGVILNPTAYYGVANTLTIRLNEREYFFELHDTLFQLEFDSPVYETSGLVRYGKDLILTVEPGQRNDEPVTLIPLRERIQVGDTDVMADYLELNASVIRVFYDAARTHPRTYPYSDLDPHDSCLYQIDPGFLGLGNEERFVYAPVTVIVTDSQPGTHYKGYAEFSREILQEGFKYEFRYECYEHYNFELPFELD